jgi:primosomal protein N' (replication factor Y)
MAIGPAPQSVGKIKDRYRQVIYLRYERMDYLILARDKILEYIEINSGFEKIRVEFDMNV